jgi:hypothetical protein
MAAVFGGFYWTALVSSFVSARASAWAAARGGIPGVLLFLLLTLLATLLHLDRFHLHHVPLLTTLAAWAWLIIYIADPVALLVAVGLQLRAPGKDAPRTALLPAWCRGVLLAQAAIALGFGVALFVVPLRVGTVWPWLLTPLTARALGAWLVGTGVIVGQAAWENDWERIRATMLSFVVFGLLQLVAIIRYHTDFRSGQVAGWAVILYVALVLLTGCYGMVASRQVRRRSPLVPA